MNLIMNTEFMSRLAWEQMCLRLSAQFRGLRASHGLTWGELAKRAGVQLRDVWRLENGYLKHITTNMLTRLAKVFDVAVDVRFVSLSDSLRQIGQPVDVPETFDQSQRS